MGLGKRSGLLPHGGDRRTGDGERSTLQLTENQARRIIDNVEKAANGPMPYNRFVTIAWGKSHIADLDNRKVTESWLRKAKRWARSRGYSLPYIGVQEWGKVNGAHVHLLIHIPHEYLAEYGQMKLGFNWAKKTLDGPYVRETFDARPLYPPRHETDSYELYMLNLLSTAHYIMKCSPAALEAKLDMTYYRGKNHLSWGQESRCYGKRIFESQ